MNDNFKLIHLIKAFQKGEVEGGISKDKEQILRSTGL